MSTPYDAPYKVAQREAKARLAKPVRAHDSDVDIEWVPNVMGGGHWIIKNREWRRAQERKARRANKKKPTR